MITPMNSLIDRALASLLFLLPASLCVVPLSIVLLTDLAGLYHQEDSVQMRRRTLSALRLVLLLTISVSIGGVLLAKPLTRLVYEYGRFRTADTLPTAQALRAYLLGLPFYGGAHMLNRCVYATHDTMTPALVSLGGLGLNAIGDIVLMRFFSHWGIVLASTVVMLAVTVALYVLFQRRCTRLEARHTILRVHRRLTVLRKWDSLWPRVPRTRGSTNG